jgi:hypothetical protein
MVFPFLVVFFGLSAFLNSFKSDKSEKLVVKHGHKVMGANKESPIETTYDSY